MGEKKVAAAAKDLAVAAEPVTACRGYAEYKLDVETVMRNKRDGGQELHYHMCEVGKRLKDVFIEPFRAEQMNRQFENRRRIYWPADKDVPVRIKRIAATDDDGNAVWKDELIYE